MRAPDAASFNLLYSGKIMSEDTLSTYGVSKEATIQVQALPPSHYTIVMGDESREITAPGAGSTPVRIIEQ